jgi:predicted alpha-1,6-mannanase (GH76 family)
MRRAIAALIGACALTACGGASSPEGFTAAPAPSAVLVAATAASSFAAQAAAARQAFQATFWDSGVEDYWKNSDHSLPAGSLTFFSDFWWEAHFFETTLDAYEVTQDPGDLQLLDEQYDGFVAAHAWDANSFNDDLTWWALALARAYEATGETRYRDRSAAIFASVAAFEDQTYGGGVWWKRDGTHGCKNMCINAPFVMTALHLYAWTGDATYLTKAENVYSWIVSRLDQQGTLDDLVNGPGSGKPSAAQYSYNYGTFVGASLALEEATGDPTYLANALAAANQAMSSLASSGVMSSEGQGDGGGFNMICARYLARLAQRGQPQIAAFLAKNANAAWANRRADGLMGYDWSAPAPQGVIQSFTAVSGVDLQYSALIATLSPSPITTRTALPALLEERITADAATLHGVSLEAQYPGFTGKGYVAGWDRTGQSVDFFVTAPDAGTYTVVLRYAAAAGNARRAVLVDGALAALIVSFPATAAWSDWGTTSVLVALQPGSNRITVSYVAPILSASDLNLDALTLAPSPGG